MRAVRNTLADYFPAGGSCCSALSILFAPFQKALLKQWVYVFPHTFHLRSGSDRHRKDWKGKKRFARASVVYRHLSSTPPPRPGGWLFQKKKDEKTPIAI